ncbi:MAG TPA: YceI family protein [Bacteroidales bacterium]|nr:YceI family protein [Bacteroidales bacterium]
MRRQLFNYTLSIVLLAISGCLYGQSAKIDTEESKVNWTGKKPAGEHKGYVKIKEGQLLITNNEVQGGSFVMDMNSITNTDIKDEKGNNKLVTHLKSPDFFDVKKFPTAKFVITNVDRINNGARIERKATHRIEGDLTMKGVTKKVSFDASINILNGKFTANTPSFTVNRTEWGVNYQSKSVMAGLRDEFIYDDMTLAIELVSE